MNQPAPSTAKHLRVVFGALAVLFGFALLAAILLTRDGGQDALALTAEGDFDEATTEARWTNLEAVEAAQAETLDEEKLGGAIESVITSAAKAKPAKTEHLVPGSETFLKQQAAAAKEAPAEGEAEAPAENGGEAKAEGGEATEGKAADEAPAEKSAEAGDNGEDDEIPAEKKAETKKADSKAADEPAEEAAADQ